MLDIDFYHDNNEQCFLISELGQFRFGIAALFLLVVSAYLLAENRTDINVSPPSLKVTQTQKVTQKLIVKPAVFNNAKSSDVGSEQTNSQPKQLACETGAKLKGVISSNLSKQPKQTHIAVIEFEEQIYYVSDNKSAVNTRFDIVDFQPHQLTINISGCQQILTLPEGTSSWKDASKIHGRVLPTS